MNGYHNNEALKFLLEEGEIRSILEEKGLGLVDHLNNDEIEKNY